jgi:hypothetical protein
MNGTSCGLALGKNEQLAKSFMVLFPATVCNQNGDINKKWSCEWKMNRHRN